MKGFMTIFGVIVAVVWIAGLLVFGIQAPAAYPIAAIILFKICSFCTVAEVVFWCLSER